MQISDFSTERFSVKDWRPLLHDATARRGLERALGEILTPLVLEHLPASLHLGSGGDAVSSWIDGREAESRVLAVYPKVSKRLIGLIILATEHEAGKRPAVHVGYLLEEKAWGQGAASELLKGLVSAAQSAAPVRLFGGVDKDNPASARVLRKAGFLRDTELSAPQREIFTFEVK